VVQAPSRERTKGALAVLLSIAAEVAFDAHLHMLPIKAAWPAGRRKDLGQVVSDGAGHSRLDASIGRGGL
jgi:hypothetical protein